MGTTIRNFVQVHEKEKEKDSEYDIVGKRVEPVVRLPASESVVNWVDTSTGARYQTTVQCPSGWLSWAISGEDCIDSIDLYDSVSQLPGD